MPGLVPFFIVLLAGLLFSEVFERLHLPYVTALIVGGMVIGPHGFDLVQIDPTLEFISEIGVIFLMFIAGSEIKLNSFRHGGSEPVVIALVNGLIPFATGFGIGMAFGFQPITSIILGTVFISSSIAVIIPTLEANNLIHTRIGQTLIPATVFEDVASLILLSVIFQSISGTSFLPWPLYLIFIIALFLLLKTVVPLVHKIYHLETTKDDVFEREMQFISVVLIATVILFESLGIHAIVAGFLIGMILGNSIRGKVEDKVRTISYGIFIPIFFMMVGVQTDISVLLSMDSLGITAAIVFGLIGAKVLSGLIAGHLHKFTTRASILMGFATIPQLSTTLATAFAASEFGLVNTDVITALVVLTIITTLISPLAIKLIAPGLSFRDFTQVNSGESE